MKEIVNHKIQWNFENEKYAKRSGCLRSLLQLLWFTSAVKRGRSKKKAHQQSLEDVFLKKTYFTEKKVHFQSTILTEEFLILQCLYFQWNLDTQNTTSRNGRLNNTCLFFYFFNPGALMISMFRYTTVSFLQNMPPTPPPLFLMITLITSLNYSADDKSKHCSVEAVRSWYLVALESATFDESMINFVSWWSKFPDNNP